jgi:hypothetical protein
LFWGPNSFRLSRCAVVAIVALSATAAAANILVVRSSGPSAKAYPPGRSLAPNARITLRQGDSLVLLDGRGTRQLRGPGTFTAGAAAQATTRAQLTTGSGGRVGRVGAVREVTEVGSRGPSVWHVDVSESSTYCVADPARVVLWRPSATRTVDLTITPGRGGPARTVSWTAGEAELAWPDGLAVASDTDYRLHVEGVQLPTEIRFKLLPVLPQGLEATATSFIRNGCQAQLDLLVDTVQLPARSGS